MQANLRPELLLKELERRKIRKFKVEDFLFKEQLDFTCDPSPFKTALCSRRSGKTVSCAADLVDTAIRFEGVVCLYITLSRNNAKKIIWPELNRIIRTYNLNGKFDQTELSVTLPNGSVIYCSGAKDKTEIEKFRGLPIKKCYIDEAQSFRSYLKELIDDVISPALMDYAGTLCLIGTPPPVPTGYFLECHNSPTWSHHAWTFWNNKFIVDKSGLSHQAVLDRELTRRGVTVDDPSVQREFFGKCVLDTDALVFKYRRESNHYDELPNIPDGWRYIVGVDVGLQDADAIAVIAYHPNHERCYLLFEDITTKQGITELALKLEKIVQTYKPDTIVMDTGGLGAKIAQEINRRFAIGVKAAEKSRKFEFIELLNDALRTQKLMAKQTSRFAQDAMLVEWDTDKSTADKRKISDRFHSDICDAVLYAYRESLHWISQPAKPVIKYQSEAWYAKELEQMEQAALNSIKHIDDDPWSSPAQSDDPWSKQIDY